MPKLIQRTEIRRARRDSPGGPRVPLPSRWRVEVERDDGSLAHFSFDHDPTNDEIRQALRKGAPVGRADIIPETPAAVTRGELDADLDRHLLRAAGLEALRAQAVRNNRGAVVAAIDQLVANVTLDAAVAMAQAYIAANP